MATTETSENAGPETSLKVCISGPSERLVGGQATVVAELIRRFSSDDAVDIALVPIDPVLPAIIRPLRRIKYVRTIVSTIAYVILLFCRVPKCDVVHVFSASYWSFLLAPTPAMLVGRLFRKGVILNYHSGELDDHLTNWRSARLFLGLAHRIVVPSAYLREIFDRHGYQAGTVPNSVDTERFRLRRRDQLRPVFLCNRNFEGHYNVSCVVWAMARIQARMPDAKLILAGDGPLRQRIQDEIREAGLKNADFCGFVSPEDMPALYNEADVYLNPSDVDNMPKSLLEAAVSGLPIITTNAGGIPYIFENERTALIVDRNDPIGMANAALRLLGDSPLVAKLTAAAYDHVLASYSWSAARRGWLSEYGQAAEHRTGTGRTD